MISARRVGTAPGWTRGPVARQATGPRRSARSSQHLLRPGGPRAGGAVGLPAPPAGFSCQRACTPAPETCSPAGAWIIHHRTRKKASLKIWSRQNSPRRFPRPCRGRICLALPENYRPGFGGDRPRARGGLTRGGGPIDPGGNPIHPGGNSIHPAGWASSPRGETGFTPGVKSILPQGQTVFPPGLSRFTPG